MFEFYLILCLVGLAYMVFSALVGGVFGSDGDSGGADGGGAEAGAHAGGLDDPSAGSVVHFSPLSPTFIAVFLTIFGAVGGILVKVIQSTGVDISVPLNLGIATVAILLGAGGSFLMAALLTKIFFIAEGSSLSRTEDSVGLEAEVVTPIPAGGTGEIFFTSRNTRRNAPAKCLNSLESVPVHSVVLIEKIVGGIYFVHRKDVGQL